MFSCFRFFLFGLSREALKTSSNFPRLPFWSARKALRGDDVKWLLVQVVLTHMFWSSFCKQTSYRDFKTMSIQPYQLEPEHSSSEQGEEEEIDSGEEEVSSLDYSRLESRWTDLSWCEMWEILCDAKWSWMCLLQRTSFFVTTGGRFVDPDKIYLFNLTFCFPKGCQEQYKNLWSELIVFLAGSRPIVS